jgi:MoaA/NifB/PqqE/SkfB family radical SAM enzyme
MTPDQLKNQLDAKFKVLCFFDLADVNQSVSAVYKILNTHHKEEFEFNERLVFYSEHAPSSELITHIQQAADLLDISRCFIMICGPQNLNDLFLPAEKFDIEYYPVTVESKTLLNDSIAMSDNMCPHPWSNLTVMNGGQVKPCCVSSDVIGHVTDQKLEDLFNSSSMNNLRDDFLSGKKPPGCSHCWNLESHDIESNRQWKLKYSGKKLYSDWITDPKIRSIDFRPGNVCNFKCRICNPVFSSLFAAEQLTSTADPEKIIELKKINLDSKWFDNDDQFIDQLTTLLPSLEFLDFYGGEPFLLKQLPFLLKKATENNHSSHIKLHFSTNGSVFPTNLISYFQKFKLVDLSLSIDNIKEKFEFERGGSWQDVETNIDRLKNEDTVNFNIGLTPTVNIQNVLYLDELFDWADTKGYNILLNFLDTPQYMNIDYMTEAAKKLVVKKYQTHSRPELQKIAHRVINSPGGDGKEFLQHMQNLDKLRSQNFLDSHKEIAIAMGYVL